MDIVAVYRQLGEFAWAKFGPLLEALPEDARRNPPELVRVFTEDQLDEFVLVHRDPWFTIRIRLVDFLYYWQRIAARSEITLADREFAGEFHALWAPKMRFLYKTLHSEDYRRHAGVGFWLATLDRAGVVARGRFLVTHRGLVHRYDCSTATTMKPANLREVPVLIEALTAGYAPCRVCRPAGPPSAWFPGP